VWQLRSVSWGNATVSSQRALPSRYSSAKLHRSLREFKLHGVTVSSRGPHAAALTKLKSAKLVLVVKRKRYGKLCGT
jgi:hypothetical protein